MSHRIDQKNRATIRDVDSEANGSLIGDQSITTVEALVRRHLAVDDADALSMHLLRGNERRAAEPMSPPDFPVNAVQPGERFLFIVRHLDICDTQGETVDDPRQTGERRKLFSRKLTCVHLPEVVRVERSVPTGFRIPAPFNSSGAGFGAGVGMPSVLNFCRVFGSSSLFE